MDAVTPKSALQRAIEKIGSQGALARLLGISQPAVWKWVRHQKPLPAEHVLAVEAATGISRHELRPDIYPIESSGECDPPEAAPAAQSKSSAAGVRLRNANVPGSRPNDPLAGLRS